LVQDHEVVPARPAAHERAGLRVHEVEAHLRHPQPHEAADERPARRPGRDPLELARLLLLGQEGLERRPRELDREEVDPVELHLPVDGQRGEQLRERQRERAVVRAQLEQLQLPPPPGARVPGGELRHRVRVQVALRLGLERDPPADRVVEPLVDLRLRQRHGRDGSCRGQDVRAAACFFERPARTKNVRIRGFRRVTVSPADDALPVNAFAIAVGSIPSTSRISAGVESFASSTCAALHRSTGLPPLSNRSRNATLFASASSHRAKSFESGCIDASSLRALTSCGLKSFTASISSAGSGATVADNACEGSLPFAKLHFASVLSKSSDRDERPANVAAIASTCLASARSCARGADDAAPATPAAPTAGRAIAARAAEATILTALIVGAASGFEQWSRVAAGGGVWPRPGGRPEAGYNPPVPPS